MSFFEQLVCCSLFPCRFVCLVCCFLTLFIWTLTSTSSHATTHVHTKNIKCGAGRLAPSSALLFEITLIVVTYDRQRRFPTEVVLGSPSACPKTVLSHTGSPLLIISPRCYRSLSLLLSACSWQFLQCPQEVLCWDPCVNSYKPLCCVGSPFLLHHVSSLMACIRRFLLPRPLLPIVHTSLQNCGKSPILPQHMHFVTPRSKARVICPCWTFSSSTSSKLTSFNRCLLLRSTSMFRLWVCSSS